MEIIVTRDTNLLVPILHDAEEDDALIVQAITDAENTAYAAYEGDECIGAAVMRWQPDESEIIYLAVRSADRGKGYGKALITQLVDLAEQRAATVLMVGTANSSIENIAFYQKCGFRIDSVRNDYYSYVHTPVYEHGILMRDMVMLRYNLANLNLG